MSDRQNYNPKATKQAQYTRIHYILQLAPKQVPVWQGPLLCRLMTLLGIYAVAANYSLLRYEWGYKIRARRWLQSDIEVRGKCLIMP